jgi:hypothetical protein
MRTTILKMKATNVFFISLFLIIAAMAPAQRQAKTVRYRFGGADGGGMFQLALRPDVQNELKITQVQHRELAAVDKKMQSKVADILTAKHPTNIGTAIAATGESFAAQLPTILKPAQYTRLRGLLLQKASFTALMRKDVQTDLAFTKEQRLKVVAAQAALAAKFKTIQKLKDRKAMRPQIIAAVNAHNEALQAILTTEQAAKFETMKGKPFKFGPDI